MSFQIGLLDQDQNCYIKDIATLRGKLESFINGGICEVQVCLDVMDITLFLQ